MKETAYFQFCNYIFLLLSKVHYVFPLTQTSKLHYFWSLTKLFAFVPTEVKKTTQQLPSFYSRSVVLNHPNTVTGPHEIILMLLHSCNFATVINHFDMYPKGVKAHRLRTTAVDG